MNALRHITEPGIYFDMPADTYFADPCPSPSLTQSIAKVLIDRSPRHAWYAHPRLNPNYERDDPTKFDLGNIAHRYMTGRGRDVIAVPFDDWRTKDAKAAREEALAGGKLAVLDHQNERVLEMVAAARKQLAASDISCQGAFADGSGEVVIAWREGENWFRSMIDWFSGERLMVWDFKTTAASAAPHALAQKMAADGWCIQAAMHERGLAVLHPEGAGRRRHRFVCQEAEPPYALTITELSESALTIGRKQLEHAIGLWAACMRAGDWPHYPLELQSPEYPGWAESRWLDREIAHEERRVREPMLTDLAGG